MKRRNLFPLAILCLMLMAPLSVAAAKETWTSVRSKNFFLVGNASDKEIRRVALRLEQFRDVLGRLLNNTNLTSSTPTTVVVFKSHSAYEPFAPPNTAGYFQPGLDVNYISLSAETRQNDPFPFSVIFHEYVHFIIKNNMQTVPVWFNEGIAEYYSTLQVTDDDRKVQLGLAIGSHLRVLRDEKLLPLKTLFAVDHTSPLYNESSKKGLFYAESWALVHYLLLGNDAKRQPQFNTFLGLLLANKPVEEAFQQAFQIDFATLEKELKQYIRRDTYPGQIATFERKLEFDAEMQSAPLSEAEAQYYLGDLLLHASDLTRAEKYLQQALKLDPNLAGAAASLGMLYMRKGNFAGARRYLEQAVSGDTRNYLAHYYYAEALSREGISANNLVSGYPPETLAKMRAELKRAIELRPGFASAYNLLAFVDLVAGNLSDEAEGYLKRAISLEPGETRHKYMLAQVYMQKQDFKAARPLLELVIRQGEAEMRAHSQQMLDFVTAMESRSARGRSGDAPPAPASNDNADDTEATTAGGPPALRNREGGSPSGAQETPRVETDGPAGSSGIKPAGPGEEQARGYLVRIDCNNTNIVLIVRVGDRLLKLQRAGLEEIEFVTYSADISGDITCGARKPENPVIVNYRPTKNARARFDGEVLTVSFVPKELLESK